VQRSSIALSVLCVLLLGLNGAQFIANQSLRREVADLQTQREEARQLRALLEARQLESDGGGAVARAKPRAGAKAARQPGSRSAELDRSRPLEPTEVAQPTGERMEAFRERMQEHMVNRMLDAVAETAYQRGWSPEMGADAAVIVEESWRSGTALREAVRDGELDATEAQDEMLVIRELAREELEALLGPAEHEALQKQMWTRPGLMGRVGVERPE